MYTLRLIVEGLIFIAYPANNVDKITLVMLNPVSVNSNVHHATLEVAKTNVCFQADGNGSGVCPERTTRSYTGSSQLTFDLNGGHVILSVDSDVMPLLATGTKQANQAKPCYGCNPPYTVAQQSEDIDWLHDLSDLAKAAGVAVDIRTDLFGAAPPGFVLSRVVVLSGEARTRTLWGVSGAEANSYPDSIGVYCLTALTNDVACSDVDEAWAVARSVAIDIPVESGAALFNFRTLAGADDTKDVALKQPAAGQVIEVKLSSHSSTPKDGDFKIFYDLLVNKPVASKMVRPWPKVAYDANGACSPIKP